MFTLVVKMHSWSSLSYTNVSMKLHHNIYRNQFPNPVQSISFSPLLFLLETGFGENTNKKLPAPGYSTMLCPPTGTCCQIHPRIQKTLRCRRHSHNFCNFVFNSLVNHRSHWIPFLTIPPASLSSQFPPHPFVHDLHQACWACGCLHGVKLHYTSGHWHWHLVIHQWTSFFL